MERKILRDDYLDGLPLIEPFIGLLGSLGVNSYGKGAFPQFPEILTSA